MDEHEILELNTHQEWVLLEDIILNCAWGGGEGRVKHVMKHGRVHLLPNLLPNLRRAQAGERASRLGGRGMMSEADNAEARGFTW